MCHNPACKFLLGKHLCSLHVRFTSLLAKRTPCGIGTNLYKFFSYALGGFLYQNLIFVRSADTTCLWYTTNHELPPKFQTKFVPLLQPDESTTRWLERAKVLSTNIWLHIWHAVARVVLQFFMTQTDINGYLNRGSMFILSEQQFGKLLKCGGFDFKSYDTIHCLDIGAGDGEITIRLLRSIQDLHPNSKIHTFATETSWTMRERLKNRNFSILERISEVQNVQLISCLNVLDRCIDPIDLLEEIYKALAPNGRVLLALVLPYVHYVEMNSSHMPLRPLLKHWPERSQQLSFEAEAVAFFELLDQMGFRIEAWTKAPYLCEGDLRQSFYWLVDIVVVLSKKPLGNKV
ncbi:methyltransferase-like protein 9 isoform X2 [Rhagoletis pomonella]|uniref:methyltransferase-like protein 9 isoform X2 n=1 Tax=Rhagoletis pomonella TaxID=28610 RepID=UPI0017839C6E|nr:methyltransferase-like protein 9 isoform X2 [Rhagoletis pomonella]XP_036344193.1 methyltransferase-like protein 9 isoform X2 [Rhagoletis pomonella]